MLQYLSFFDYIFAPVIGFYAEAFYPKFLWYISKIIWKISKLKTDTQEKTMIK